MKKNFLVIIAMCAALILSACQKKEESVPAPMTPPPEVSAPSNSGGEALNVQWADDALSGVSDYSEFSAYEGDAKVGILFSAGRTLRDFKFLSIDYKDTAADGTAIFAVEELYSQDELTPERPLLVYALSPEGIPTNGVCYTDESGATQYFSIGENGQDGSVFLSAFAPYGTP